MEAVQREAHRAAEKLFEGRTQKAPGCSPAFSAIRIDDGLDREEARALFRHAWVHAFDAGALCAIGVRSFCEDGIPELLGHDFHGLSGADKVRRVSAAHRPPNVEGRKKRR